MPEAATVPTVVAEPHWQLPRWTLLVAPLLAAALVVIATRQDPLLSPDSITYLSVADNVRAGHGLTDFTAKPLSVFGPLYPLLLAPGGRNLVWATAVGAAAIALGSVLMWLLLHRRVRPMVALAGALALGASQGLVRMASVVWSEAPYAAIALAMLVVLSRSPLTNRGAAVGGLLAGLGFLTRYAGVGLMVTGAVMVVASVWRNVDRSEVTRRLVTFATAALGIAAVWVIRNLVETGQPLGPRFEGGANEPLTRTIRLALIGTAHIVLGDGWSDPALARLGAAILIALAVMAWLALRSGRATTLDLGVAVFAVASFVVPIMARLVTANDIELRVMSPILIPLVYFACVTFDRVCTTRGAALVGAALLGWWMYQGMALAARFPDFAPQSSAYKYQYAPQLYDVIDELPQDATVLTNNPQRVWWFTGREPTLMGFTRPRPGNSHYPLDADHTLQAACNGHTYLAWFDGLLNSGGGPTERRPDLVDLVDLQVETAVPGGQLYHLAPRDASSCRSGASDPAGP